MTRIALWVATGITAVSVLACGAADESMGYVELIDKEAVATEQEPGVVLGDPGDEGEVEGVAKVDATSKKCGPFAGGGCSADQVCNIESCGEGASGACVVKPLPNKCPASWAPVCGCDGKSYSNDCVRIRAGTSKKADGACKNIKCSGNGGCPTDMVCDLREPTTGAPLSTSYCVPKPKECPSASAPVCGGNPLSEVAKTFRNDCLRILAGAPFLHSGECTASDSQL